MPDRSDILWFKQAFRARIEPALAGTPLTVDFITALACQETGEVWPLLRRAGLPVDRVLALCVGDTLDADRGRSAFPKTKAELLGAPQGAAMFAVAREALVEMARHIPAYQGAAGRPAKFCHGFGLFQRDLQFFKREPGYFLNREYALFEMTFGEALDELRRGLRVLGFERRSNLRDEELAAVGIVYNTGGFKPAKGLRQGHFNGSQFYGEALLDFIRLAHTVSVPGELPVIATPADGTAIVAPPTPVGATGPRLLVRTLEAPLRLRSAPVISDPPDANVRALLPDGHPVQAVGHATGNSRFIEVETTLNGALLRGFASRKFLVPDESPAPLEPLQPEPQPPTSGIIAVNMPRRPGTLTRRRDPAGAHSLNEPGQPGRSGSTPAELRAQMAAIVDWLAVDDVRHLRYQPRAGATFCNIFAHDACHLAGVYLPRVWWLQDVLPRLERGEVVAPLIGQTIGEQRANDLFRWLQAFGPRFGWRRTGTTAKLQTEVNLGALGLIVARRKEDGRSGHIVLVMPETPALGARRNAAGEVTAPVQSQAGARNFRLGTGKPGWWLGEEFAEAAFWLHA
jgi:hypothetical protein